MFIGEEADGSVREIESRDVTFLILKLKGGFS